MQVLWDPELLVGVLGVCERDGVEMRNKNWLKPEYFECLARHQVSHVFNSWEAMPPVGEQMALPGSRTNPDLIAARFLLKPGREYEQAVKAFEPYDRIKEENPEARAAVRAPGHRCDWPVMFCNASTIQTMPSVSCSQYRSSCSRTRWRSSSGTLPK